MNRVAVGSLTALIIQGCGGAGAQGPHPLASDEAGAAWERVIYDIPVVESDGTPIPHPFLGGLNLPRPQLLDADGDGDLDLFLQEVSGSVMFFEQTEAGDGLRFEWRSDRFEDLEVGEWFRFVDVDLDGDLDLLSEEMFSHLRFYRNDGGPGQRARYSLAADTLRDVAGNAIFSDRQNIPNATDIDCDGAVDLLVGRLTGTISRYEAEGVDADGVPRFRLVTDRFEGIEIVAALQGSLHGANTMALGDVDEDGDVDLFWGDYFEAGLLFIENSGSCAEPSLRSDPLSFPLDDPVRTSGYNAPALGDLDGDGDVDLLMGVLGGAFNPNTTSIDNLFSFIQDDDGRFHETTRRLIHTLDVGSESYPSFRDLDGDGDLDLLVSNKIRTDDPNRGALFVFENDGSPSAPSFRGRGTVDGLAAGYHYAPAFIDVDGDGDDDILMGGWQDEISYYRNDGDGFPPRWTLADTAFLTLTRGRNAAPALGDLDGDGDQDLLVGEASGALNYYVNEGRPGAPEFRLLSDEFQDIDVGRRSVPFLVDLDDDGDLDLAVGSESSGLHIYRNVGSRTDPRFEVDVPLDLEMPAFTVPNFVDLDDDGDLDFVTGGSGGGLIVYRRR